MKLKLEKHRKTVGEMSIFTERTCEDDFSWDRERRSNHTLQICRERMREKPVKMSYSERQEHQQIQKERDA